jgi:hypothetical protein
MKIEIRQSVFETNSSSTHSLAYGYENDINKFLEGELLIIKSLKECGCYIFDKTVTPIHLLTIEEINNLEDGFIFTPDNKNNKSNYLIKEGYIGFEGKLEFINKKDKIPKGYIAISFSSIEDMNEDLDYEVEEISMDGKKKIKTICFYGRRG